MSDPPIQTACRGRVSVPDSLLGVPSAAPPATSRRPDGASTVTPASVCLLSTSRVIRKAYIGRARIRPPYTPVTDGIWGRRCGSAALDRRGRATAGERDGAHASEPRIPGLHTPDA